VLAIGGILEWSKLPLDDSKCSYFAIYLPVFVFVIANYFDGLFYFEFSVLYHHSPFTNKGVEPFLPYGKTAQM